jgi:alpha-galactosidase
MIIMATIGVSTLVHAGEGARTDWFKDAGYGLFCHWSAQSVNADGSQKDYYTAVREFDVNAFANQVEEAGAKFVIFTIIHGRHELAFPSAVMDRICPGHTSPQRDLYADMYTALHARGIRMIFYWNGFAATNEPDWHDGSKWATDKAYFVQKVYELAEEIGNRYGDRLAGWWVDQCYDNDPRLPADCRNWGAKYDFAKYAAKLRAGNTNRIVAFNFRWKFWGCDWGKGIMDYQAGEEGLDNNWLPASRFAGEGGTQWFACDATDDPNWVHVKPGVVKPRYATDRVITYIRNVISNQGVYAYNCALYNNGKIAEDTMVQLRAVKKAIRGDAVASAAKPVSAGRILFLGNSITRHPPKADIGWTNDFGMAASALEKDYVHLLLKRFTDATGGKAPEARIENAADFEREYATYPIATKFKELAEFKADTVILCIAENVPRLGTQAEQDRFKAAVKELLTFVKGNGSPVIYVRSSFWPDGVKDGILKQVCTELGGTFVDISRLGSDPKNYARSERKFSHDGVAAHPGDAGMAAIAEAIWGAVSKGEGL